LRGRLFRLQPLPGGGQMTLTLHRFVPLLALAFPGDALAQNAPEPPVNNGHDLTRPLHSITVFQNYTAPSDGINSYTTTLRYERPVYLQDNWKFAYRFELLRPIATDVGPGCDGRFGVAR